MKDERKKEPGAGFFVVSAMPGEVGIAAYTGNPGFPKFIREMIISPEQAEQLAATIMQAAEKAREA